jgi:putative protease
LTDIAAIRAKTDAELEVFVHGALCIAYSGQCLTSEAIGGRSANRGACAQACRLPYELVVDGVVRDLGEHAYLLSPEDLEASALVPRLAEIGVASIKIEGRLKGPEYVAAVTQLYRKAVDAVTHGGSAPSEADRRTALQAYSRGSGPGFLAGVDHQRLVDGRTCDHRGLLIGESRGGKRVRGKACIAVRASDGIARGDGVLVEGGFGGDGEIGGRVWSIFVERAGKAASIDEVERAAPHEDVLLWLGPEKHFDPATVPTGRRVWKTSDPARTKEAHALATREGRRVALDLRVAGSIGEAPILEGTTSDGRHARVVLDAALEVARSAPLTAEAVREKLAKLGDTPFTLGRFTFDAPSTGILPLSSLNRARRTLVDALLAASPAPHATTAATAADLVSPSALEGRAPPTSGLFVLCRSLAQAHAALDAGADGVVLDFLELTGTGHAVRELRARATRPHITLAPPRIRKPGEEKIDAYLATLEPDAILVRSLGALHDAPKDGVPRIGDFSLNVANTITAHEVLARGLAAFTPSFDLDATQLVALLGTGPGRTAALAPFAEVVLHHPMPLFHMEHCVIAALLSEGRDHKTCGRPCEHHKVSLRDRSGIDHPVEADVGCRNTVFHAAAQSAAHLVPGLRERGVRRFRVELVREEASDVARVVRAYRALLEGSSAPADVWRTLKTEGGYGVVKGSLRVLRS